MRRWTASVLLAVCLIMGSAQLTQAKTLGISPVTQENSNWCWAATGQMILAYFGVSASQCSIVSQVYPFCPNWTATLGQLGTSLRSLGNLASTYVTSSQSWSSVKSAIDGNSPMGFRWAWTSGGGHIMVINGYETDVYNNQYVWYLDSMTYHILEDPSQWVGTQQMASYSYMVGGSGYDHTWTHSLINIKKN